ncbi:MAG: ATP-binding cassette domain-containing protein [Flavobacteriaceae bacterium]
MKVNHHWAIFINNSSDKQTFIAELFDNTAPKGFESLMHKRGRLFSKLALDEFMDEEDRHGQKVIAQDADQSLRSMSSGEQKKVLLKHILKSEPDYIILDNPFDNLDIDAQQTLRETLNRISKATALILLISRKEDILPIFNQFATLNGKEITFLDHLDNHHKSGLKFKAKLPAPLSKIEIEGNTLIELKSINVSYSGRPILKNINWKIVKGDFWQLVGKNGSGKTTILSMITGENPKGYGQELYIFGQKKGSGESVWDIKKRIGYFTPSMTDKFMGYHTVEHMLISGLTDSIGLYTIPSEAQLRLAKEWLQLIDMFEQRHTLFHELTMGQKRLVMTARAMVKHPLLLILDEPTAGLDDSSAAKLIALVNKMAKESVTAIIFVSHRTEKGLKPSHTFELQLSNEGSTGYIKQQEPR